jgi:IS4 transposase
MYRNTRFGELMKGLSRGYFNRVTEETGADKYSKGFRCWDQLLVMIYAQISGSTSLRSLLSRFNGHKAQHYHLGTREIKRSTLADANGKRDITLFKALCDGLLQQAHRRVRRDYRDLLYLLDSTPIPLKGYGHEWTEDHKTSRTQGLKVHLLYAPQADVPVYSAISSPNINDIEDARGLEIEAGATYVFDKGYCDYNWWHKMDQQGAFFVTRFKNNASLVTLHDRTISAEMQGIILEDSDVRFKNKRPGGGRINQYQQPLRRIVVNRPDKATPLIIATNDLERPAEEIAELYKARWGIELFFKWLKQNLRIKQFLGRSENAVRIQILTALITYLLMDLYRQRHRITTSLRLLVAELSVTLFQRPRIEEHVVNRYRRRRMEFEQIQRALPI